MDAIILVGGQGTRLRPLTLHRHKSLVPVANRPAIGYLFDWLQKHGVARVVLALGQQNEDLAEAFPPGSVPGLEVVAVFEQMRLESGGAIRNAVAEAGIEERFVVLNGDVYVDFDLGEALAEHEAAQAKLTLALAEVGDPSPFGVAVTDEAGRVTGFVEKPPRAAAPSNKVNAGVWVFEREIVEQIPPGAVRVEETLFPSLVARGRGVYGYNIDGLWADIGTPARYLALNVALAGQVPAGHAQLHQSFAGDGCRLDAESQVEESVLWEGVHIEAGATVRRSVLADGVLVGEGASVEGMVAGRDANVPAGAIVPSGTVLQPGSTYDPTP
jgi:mannose-1-phosphate guanylyltransferase